MQSYKIANSALLLYLCYSSGTLLGALTLIYNLVDTAILLINIGTPEAPTTQATKAYLKEFLSDPLVLDMPSLLRKLLLHGVILPFRSPRSAKRYQQLWRAEGSPLLVHLNNLRDKLQASSSESLHFFAAMRYGKPCLSEVLAEIRSLAPQRLLVVPLFPHFAQATTLTSIEAVKRLCVGWNDTEISYVEYFHDDPRYIAAVAKCAQGFVLSDYDHILFSYHSLPLKQVKRFCTPKDPSYYCYEDSCYQSSSLLAEYLQLSQKQFSTAFQSRLTNRWLAPFTKDELLKVLAEGKKKVLVFCPSFVADCLETSIEIGEEYQSLFIERGGEKLDLVPSLNSSDFWVDGLLDMICTNTKT